MEKKIVKREVYHIKYNIHVLENGHELSLNAIPMGTI